VIATTGRTDREALQAREVDAALDLVGGDDIHLLLDTLRSGGLLLEVAGYPSDELEAAAKERSVRVLEPLVEPDGHALEQIATLVDSGDLKVIIDEVFPLERAAAAHERLERGGVRGKLVLEMSHD
jgi:NADPH:quinone reductase-like Zn-dependent oxidoreductase